MKEKFELIKKELNNLNNSKISLLDLMVYDEIDCQLEEEITNEEFIKIFCSVENAYLKTDYTSLWSITRYCIENLDKLEDLSSWEIVENSYECF